MVDSPASTKCRDSLTGLSLKVYKFKGDTLTPQSLSLPVPTLSPYVPSSLSPFVLPTAGRSTSGNQASKPTFRHPTPDIRHPPPDIGHPTSGIRHPTSNIPKFIASSPIYS